MYIYSETALISSTTELWHLRLAHIQNGAILEMVNKEAVEGLETKIPT